MPAVPCVRPSQGSETMPANGATPRPRLKQDPIPKCRGPRDRHLAQGGPADGCWASSSCERFEVGQNPNRSRASRLPASQACDVVRPDRQVATFRPKPVFQARSRFFGASQCRHGPATLRYGSHLAPFRPTVTRIADFRWRASFLQSSSCWLLPGLPPFCRSAFTGSGACATQSTPKRAEPCVRKV